MGCGVCLAPAAFACSCILWQRYVRLWFRNLPSLSGATRELHGPLRSERGGATLGPRWGADPLPGVAGAALSPGGVKYFVACAARPSARSSRCFVAGALLSQGPVQISWQAQHFQGQAQPSCQAHHFCQVRLRFPNRALRRATRLLAAPAEIPCCSYGSKRQLIDS